MGEVVVIEVDTIGIIVIVLEVLLSIHEDLHWLTALLHPSNEEDAADWDEHLKDLHSRSHQVVAEVLDELAGWDGLETILGVEVPLWVDSWVVDASDNPRWSVERTDDALGDVVGASAPAMRTHDSLTGQREPVQIDWSDEAMLGTTERHVASWQRASKPRRSSNQTC